MEAYLRSLVTTALWEDFRYGSDAATIATTGSHNRDCLAVVRAREAGILAGVEVLPLTVEQLAATPNAPEGTARVEILIRDGEPLEVGEDIARITGATEVVLAAERTMLNVLSHASGIATATRRWVDAVAGTRTRIRDTRKTLPGLRELQKYAVRCGGGVNHRMGLGDAAMVKDNHLVDRSPAEAFTELARRYPQLPREIEVDTLEQLAELLPLQPELILLDNFSVEDTARAVDMTRSVSPTTALESSGGLRVEVAADYAATGVDFLAVGALTHSVRALDIGLDFE